MIDRVGRLLQFGDYDGWGRLDGETNITGAPAVPVAEPVLRCGEDKDKLPKEAESNHSAGIDRQWVIDNWNKWIYETCNIDDVYVIKNYPVPVINCSIQQVQTEDYYDFDKNSF